MTTFAVPSLPKTEMHAPVAPQMDLQLLRSTLGQDLGNVEEAALRKVHRVILAYFKETPILKISMMKGGYDALTFCIDTASKKYVFRIFRAVQSAEVTKREIAAMKLASSTGIGPNINYVADDESTLLMDFIEGNTLTLEEAKERENCKKIAAMIRKAHRMERNSHPSHTLIEDAVTKYGELGFTDHLEGGLTLIRKLDEELSQFEGAKVDTHGDLTPRNIFLDSGLLIDWTYSRWEDPFYDLSYFSLFHDYSEQEEQHLLASYLERSPTSEEKNRFHLTKKILLVNFSFIFQSIEQELTQKIDSSRPLEPWSYYVQLFASNPDPPEHFFHDWSRLSFQMAKSI